jgi:myo-inositol-1(or 4)-monophosphatase
MVTEAGGLIGNFTGESDFLYQREVVAGNPKIYGQLVTVLSPFTRILKDVAPASSLAGMVAAAKAGMTPEEAFAAAESGEASDTPAVVAAPAKKQATRIRKADMPDATF